MCPWVDIWTKDFTDTMTTRGPCAQVRLETLASAQQILAAVQEQGVPHTDRSRSGSAGTQQVAFRGQYFSGDGPGELCSSAPQPVLISEENLQIRTRPSCKGSDS
jgi:hypothetical protein